jgi:hypothetical protein
MDQLPPTIPTNQQSDSDGAGEARLRREAEMIAEAVAELDRGEGISGDAVWDMLDAFARGDPFPPLPAKR